MIIDSNRYWMLVSSCLALAKSLARQVGILDLKGILVLNYPESGIQHRYALGKRLFGPSTRRFKANITIKLSQKLTMTYSRWQQNYSPSSSFRIPGSPVGLPKETCTRTKATNPKIRVGKNTTPCHSMAAESASS